MDTSAEAARVSLSLPVAVPVASGSSAVATLTSGSVVRPGANCTGTLNCNWLPAPAARLAPLALKLLPPIVLQAHLLTFGSPIDRINYFFQLGDRGSYRFNRFSDELLGHCFDLPFRDGDQQILWINVRDPADPVASRLFSPRGSRLETELILEVESACGHFPEPAQAHTRYFDTHVAGKLLFDACILGRRSVQLQLERPAWSGRFARRLKAFFALLVPLLCLGMAVSGVAYWANWTDALLKAQVFILVVVAAILLLVALGAAADRKHSLVLPP